MTRPPALDHLVYGVPDLAGGTDRLAGLLGVRPAAGGRHAQWGTHNALVALGPKCYLEVIAPDPDAHPPDRGFPFGLDGLETPRLLTWALRHPEIDSTASDHGLGRVQAGHRQRSDETMLEWRLSDPYAERMSGLVPFLIDWCGSPHPAGTAPVGCELVGLYLRHPSPGDVRHALHGLGVNRANVDPPVSVETGERGLSATIRTAGGLVELR